MSSITTNPYPPQGFKFLTSRLQVLAGYVTDPTTYDAMLFYLPPFSHITTRAVRIRNRLWELWSPNSDSHAFYPGLSKENMLTGTELQPESRRCDGHLGRFDYSVTPQHFEYDRPWLGYLKKNLNPSLPENRPATDVWMPDSRRFYANYISSISQQYVRLLKLADNLDGFFASQSTVIPKRPSHLTVNGALRLNSVRNNDEAVDELASVQRDFKELDAWIRMAQSIRNGARNKEKMDSVPRADDSLIGVWLNGCDEDSGLWLLRSRVPCYIVHEGDSDQDWARILKLPVQCVTMAARTHIASMDSRTRAYERRFYENGQELTTLDKDNDVSLYKNIPRSMRADRTRSSSNGQGFVEGIYTNPRIAVTSSSFSAPELKEKDGKIQPPRVMVAEEKGSWTHWMQDSLENGMECLRRRSKSYSDLQGSVYYDRKLKRILYLEEPISIPLHYEAKYLIFGVPAPALPYIFSSDDVNYRSYDPSEWIYSTRDPLKEHVGLEYDGTIGETPQVTPVEEDSESSVSLGSEYDYASEVVKDPVDQDKMVLDETPRLEEPPLVTRLEIPKNSGRPSVNDSRETDAEFQGYSRGRSGDRYSPREREHRTRPPSPYAYRGRNFRQPRIGSRSPRRYHRRDDSRHYSPPREYNRDSYAPRRRSRSPYSRPGHRRSRSPIPRRLESYNRTPPRMYASPRKEVRHDFIGAESQSSWLQPPPTASSSLTNLPTFAPAPQENGNRRSLISRISQFTEDRKQLTVAGSTSSSSLILKAVSASTMAKFPALDAPPESAKRDIETGGQSRFLIIWNLPILLCWDNVLEWLGFVLTLCTGVRIAQVLRTNEMGFQIFWLVFKNEVHAQRFRGIVASRFAVPGLEVKCDYATEDEYSAVAGQCIDRWDDKKGFFSNVDGSMPFSNEVRPYVSHAKLAERLGVTYIPAPRKRRRNRKKESQPSEEAQSADGGAL